MVRLLIGCFSNGALVMAGYLVVGLLGVVFVRSTTQVPTGTDTFDLWFNVATSVLVALVALGAAALNVRLVPAGTLRPGALAAVAFAIPVIVAALLTVDYARTYGDPRFAILLVATVGVGAAIGSALASGALAAIRNR